MRLIQITGGTLALPEFGDARFCESYDEDCDELDHVWCASGCIHKKDGKLYYAASALLGEAKPCPYLD